MIERERERERERDIHIYIYIGGWGGANGSAPNREIGIGSVAPCVIAPRARARRGEAKLREIRALLRPIDAPNGRPPSVPGAPPDCPDDCPGCAVLPAPAARSRESNFDSRGGPEAPRIKL